MRCSATAMSHGVEKLFAPFDGIRRSRLLLLLLLLDYFPPEQGSNIFLYGASPTDASTIQTHVFIQK
jgi:hypothetical protein